LLISTIEIADINISNWRYPQLQLLISLILNELLISVIGIVDINNSNY